MQCAAIEMARNVLGIKNANSTEFNKNLHEDEQVGSDVTTIIHAKSIQTICPCLCRAKRRTLSTL